VEIFNRYKPTVIGISLGAIGGFLYYYHIGCVTGSCPITSQPINSTIYGALMGGLLVNSIKKK
jgi:hypothetical protein